MSLTAPCAGSVCALPLQGSDGEAEEVPSLFGAACKNQVVVVVSCAPLSPDESQSSQRGRPQTTTLRGGALAAAPDLGVAAAALIGGMVRVINERDSVMTNFEVASLLMQQQRQRDEDEKALPLPGARRGESSGTTPWSSQQSAAIVGEQVMSYLGGALAPRRLRRA